MTRSFWSRVHREWKDIVQMLGHSLCMDFYATTVPLDDYSAMTPYTIAEDLELCKRHHSPRLLTYLSFVGNQTLDGYLIGLLNESENKNSGSVWQGCHPLPA